MDLPPGPRAPAVWQTVAWTVRPTAFLRGIHDRFGDPVTVRTYWTEEPMVIFSHPDAVREIFRLDPAIAPAGQSWEYVRPFAGSTRSSSLTAWSTCASAAPSGAFHGARMAAFARAVAELAQRELSVERPVITLERMKHLTLEIILRVVFGARGEQETARCATPSMARSTRSARCRGCWPWRSCSETSGRAARGAVSPRGRALRRAAAGHRGAAARRAGRRHGARPAARAARRGRQPAVGPAHARPARRAPGRGPRHARPRRWPGPSSGSRGTRRSGPAAEGDPAYLDAVVKEVLRARPA